VTVATLLTLTTEHRGRWHQPRYKYESKQTLDSKCLLVLETALAFNVIFQNTDAHQAAIPEMLLH
jgi:hypothetical protein